MNAATDSRLDPGVRALYPFASHYAEVTHGARQHYVDEGQGETLLFVHGNPTWSFYWRKLIQGLSDRYRCVAPDHVGCGLSDQPDGYPYTIPTHIDNLVKLVETLDLREVTLIAHDWGGPTGFGTALRLPDRFKRLVFLNTGLFQGPIPPSIQLCRVPGLGRVLIQGLNGFVRVGFLRAVADRGAMQGEVARGYLAPYDTWAHRAAQHAFVQEIPSKPSHANWDLIQRIDAGTQQFQDRPTMLLWGDQDFCFTPWFREQMQQRFPTAEVHAWPDVGHWVAEEASERVIPLIRAFLEKHPL